MESWSQRRDHFSQRNTEWIPPPPVELLLLRAPGAPQPCFYGAAYAGHRSKPLPWREYRNAHAPTLLLYNSERSSTPAVRERHKRSGSASSLLTRTTPSWDPGAFLSSTHPSHPHQIVAFSSPHPHRIHIESTPNLHRINTPPSRAAVSQRGMRWGLRQPPARRFDSRMLQPWYRSPEELTKYHQRALLPKAPEWPELEDQSWLGTAA